ncbi:hypothetical protein FIBSPDRAFT_727341, partial [Athelia psychrophila]
GCKSLAGACWAAAGFTFGTTIVLVRPAILACNVGLGTYMLNPMSIVDQWLCFPPPDAFENRVFICAGGVYVNGLSVAIRSPMNCINIR